MPAIRRDRSFLLKAALAIGLVGAADGLFYGQEGIGGWTIGLFALALLGAALATHRALRRSRTALSLALFAFLFALIQIETVSLLAWVLYWLALMLAVMTSRAGGAPDVWLWLQRLVPAGVYAWVKPALDMRRLWRASSGLRRVSLSALSRTLVVPLVGGVLFVFLFAAANPVISSALGGLSWPAIDGWRLAFWGFVLILAWCVLRPPFRRKLRVKTRPAAKPAPPMVSASAMLVSLSLFNLLFAIENGLDLAFLWSGAPLPGHVTLADYAHRGAFSLIVAALLVAAFVLLALDPRSPLARIEALRRLVILWIVQTLFLVASSILRTWDYVESYSLTGFRVCALAWMALVAIGLMLVCWRLLRGKTSAWLVNANVAAAALVLAVISMVDVDAVAADWNVRNAREMGGRGVALDVCFLEGQGESAIVPMAEVLSQPLTPQLHARVASAFWRMRSERRVAEADWRSWTWRRTRRLARAQGLTRGLIPPKDWESEPCMTENPVNPPSSLTSAPHA